MTLPGYPFPRQADERKAMWPETTDNAIMLLHCVMDQSRLVWWVNAEFGIETHATITAGLRVGGHGAGMPEARWADGPDFGLRKSLPLAMFEVTLAAWWTLDRYLDKDELRLPQGWKPSRFVANPNDRSVRRVRAGR